MKPGTHGVGLIAMKRTRTLCRRTVLAGIGGSWMLLSSPTRAQECRTLCEDHCQLLPGPIALVTHLTGFGAPIGVQHVAGAELATAQLTSEGTDVSLIIYDTETNPWRGYEESLKAIEQDGAKLVIGPLGLEVLPKLADAAPHVIFINLQEEEKEGQRLPNVLTLPPALFNGRETAEEREGCPDSPGAWVTYTAIQVLEVLVREAQTNELDVLLTAIREIPLETTFGPLRVEGSVFRSLE